jgi:hypothetical protein
MVSRQARWRRKRFAEDAEFRARERAMRRAYWQAHKDELNARARRRRRTDPVYRDRKRSYSVRRYGMSTDDYRAMAARQGDVCAICKKKRRYPLDRKRGRSLAKQRRRPLVIDHCHATRKVRGLLCLKCNLGLGMYDDDPALMRAAAAYLEAARWVGHGPKGRGLYDREHAQAGADRESRHTSASLNRRSRVPSLGRRAAPCRG